MKIFLNGERLKVKGFSDYVDLYLEAEENAPKIYEKVSDRWEVATPSSDDGFQQFSFVNAIATTKGGTHVNASPTRWRREGAGEDEEEGEDAEEPEAGARQGAPEGLRQRLIENPAFDSQTKETLMTRASNSFGSKCDGERPDHQEGDGLGVLEQILSFAQFKQNKELKKQDGKKKQRLAGIPKLDDANDAGGRNSEHCTLILTEGDSAKALAVSGLSVIGRDYYGVFPLRGKLLNVRDASHDQIMNNAEISHIKQILGLRHGTQYDEASRSRCATATS